MERGVDPAAEESRIKIRQVWKKKNIA